MEYSKKLSTEIEIKVKIAKETESKINKTSEGYRPAANRGALFYFMLSDLPKIHSFYKFSLEAFIIVMNRAIDKISENKMYSGDLMDAFGSDEKNVLEEHNDDEIYSPTKSPGKKKELHDEDLE